jgi:oxygen-independent coproporphyrinogen III oxidase
MARVYLHIPFCRKACHYCDFHFSTRLGGRDALVQAMHAEVGQRSDFFPQNTQLESVYFGGGTPSVLTPAQVGGLLAEIHAHWPVVPGAEVTLEANPDDLQPDYLAALRDQGINRLSIGVQSFHEAELQAMNRSHDATQALAAVAAAQATGFDNISIDLIYGMPGSTMAGWEANVHRAIDLGVPHISAYALTVEKKTALQHLVKKGEVQVLGDEAYVQQYFRLIELLEAAGYQHYELSNFALPGMRSRHNSAYWEGDTYLGLGPSAHSYDGLRRAWNIANNAKYLQAITEGRLALAAEELLTPADRLNEYLMTGLRKAEGIDLTHIQRAWGIDLLAVERAAIADYQAQGWLELRQDRLQLSRSGKMMSDQIIAGLFQVS